MVLWNRRNENPENPRRLKRYWHAGKNGIATIDSYSTSTGSPCDLDRRALCRPRDVIALRPRPYCGVNRACWEHQYIICFVGVENRCGCCIAAGGKSAVRVAHGMGRPMSAIHARTAPNYLYSTYMYTNSNLLCGDKRHFLSSAHLYHVTTELHMRCRLAPWFHRCGRQSALCAIVRPFFCLPHRHTRVDQSKRL